MRRTTTLWRRLQAATRLGLFSCLLASGAVVCATASAQVSFKPFAAPGQMAKTTVEAKTTQVLSIAGMDLETSSEQTNVAVTTNGQKAADGSVISHTKMEMIKATINAPGGISLNFDSANPEATGDAGQLAPVVDLLKAALATEYDAKIGKDGRTIEVKLAGNAGAGLSAEARKMFDERMNPKMLMEQSNEEIDRLPKGPVKVGDVWEKTNKLNLDGGQSMSFQEEYTFKGEEQLAGKKLYRVDSKAKSVTYTVDAGAGAPFSVKSSDLKVTESTGHFLFDPKLGGVVGTASKTRVQGDIVLVAGGMELPGKLDLTIDTKSTVE